MRARVYRAYSGGLCWGQIFNEKSKRWETVTISYFTEWGARKALEKWSKIHCPKEFVL